MEEEHQLDAHISSKLKEEEKQIDNELEDANIDSTDRIFDKIIDIDSTDRIFDKIIDLDENTRHFQIVEKFNDFWRNTEKQMADATVKYQTEVKAQHRNKSDAINDYESEKRKEELQALNKRKELINDYQNLQKPEFEYMKTLKGKVSELTQQKNKMIFGPINALHKEFSKNRSALFKTLQIAADKLKGKIIFINNDIIAKTINFCSSLKEAFDQFDGVFRTYSLDYQVKFEQQCHEDEEFAPSQNEDLYILMFSKEILNKKLDGAKDFISKYVEKEIEGKINQQIKQDWEETEKEIILLPYTTVKKIEIYDMDDFDKVRDEIFAEFFKLGGVEDEVDSQDEVDQ